MSSTELPSLLTATASPKASAVRVAPGERLRSVRLPGITLSVRSRPPAREGLPPALYVHGLGGSSQNWSALMPLLDELVDGEALDLPGFGDSPPPDDGNYSVTGHARAVIRHLDAAGRGPVHLFGNSLGGAITTRVAALRPDLVRTLTLVSPALPELFVQRTAVPTGMLALPGVSALFTRFTKGWSAEQRVRGVMALCYGDPGRVTDEGFRNAVEEMERRLQLPYMWDALTRSARGLVDAYTLGGQHSLWRQAERVLAPTLLVYGRRDQLVGYRMAQRAARSFRDSRLVSLPDAGHVAMMEYPEAVAAAFRELLADSQQSGAAAVDGAMMGSVPGEWRPGVDSPSGGVSSSGGAGVGAGAVASGSGSRVTSGSDSGSGSASVGSLSEGGALGGDGSAGADVAGSTAEGPPSGSPGVGS
ncbi:alpha/beta fold hydrolase [Streptomyces griseiscabiei]|uniref:Alpha/beta hydrolase n=1 Tax=Streptomyces griseiscabiei TaxID=2993540 RepID=A0ABU4L9E1_9ACTN|nr:alpha/beta hydrolase [Streptomyces griseiscabiei]MBZ3903628.1 alpha/beta hydrolase [Streptomyces griseiscabiei]MDX2912372.1 alpha/beta hydrolase [Streptomyces griseiscabiei]